MDRFEDAQLARQRHAWRRGSSRSFAVSSRVTATTAGRQAAFPTRLKNPRRGMWTRSGRFWTRATSSGASRPGGRLLWRPRGGSASGSPLGRAFAQPCPHSPVLPPAPLPRAGDLAGQCGAASLCAAHLTFRSQHPARPRRPQLEMIDPGAHRPVLRPDAAGDTLSVTGGSVVV